MRRGSGWGWRYGEEDEYGTGLARVGGLDWDWDFDGIGTQDGDVYGLGRCWGPTGTVIMFRIVMRTGIPERDGKDERTGLG